jgi:cytochrome P450
MKSADSGLSLAHVLQPGYADNPYSLYQRLREKGPVYWDDLMACWVVTNYSCAVDILRDSRFSAQVFRCDLSGTPDTVQAQYRRVLSIISRMLFLQDPPDHTRLRALVSRAFTPRAIEGMRAHIHGLTDQLLEAAMAPGHMDVLHDFAFQVPTMVIADLLGVPREDSKLFFKWANELDTLVQEYPGPLEQKLPLMQSASECVDYFSHLLQQRRARPQDDLLQVLVTAEDQNRRLSEEELLGTCVVLLVAGLFTTSHLISNSLYVLLQHPAHFQMLQRDPDLIPQAIIELLRYETPIHEAARIATAESVVAGQHVLAGKTTLISLGAANHDPQQFPDPERLDFFRFDNKPISFGYGIHYCLGASLAQLETEIALGELLRRLRNPAILMAEWESGRALRGLRTFSISFDQPCSYIGFLAI